jgi:hypothetical protein
MKTGISRKLKYRLKATSSPTLSVPPMTCLPPTQMIKSVARLAIRKIKGKVRACFGKKAAAHTVLLPVWPYEQPGVGRPELYCGYGSH